MRKEPDFIESHSHNELVGGLDECAGICINCKHKDTCMFPGSSDSPKLFCEEYECLGASCSEVKTSIGLARSTQVESLNEHGAGESAVDKYLGLCVNCEYREQCSLTNTPGGIWFCEEYR